MGAGTLRLNSLAGSGGKSRLVMRRDGNFEVILNSLLFAGMTCNKGYVSLPSHRPLSLLLRGSPAMLPARPSRWLHLEIQHGGILSGLYPPPTGMQWCCQGGLQ
ncbi:hypothetical protein T484DRAFT_3155039 [Baffinella frigidus]|nr:hypothetical protein T484DRAFT_3155039 [Cryptophyta sp. CCMP2293]